MTTQQFKESLAYLMKSKGRRVDDDMLIVWYSLLVTKKGYTAKMINYACEQLIFSDNQFPAVNDFVKIINPQQDPLITASNHLAYIEAPNGERPPELAYDTFYTMFSEVSDYKGLTGDKKRWARKEFIDLYIKNMQESKRLLQIAEVNDKKLIGDEK